MANITVNIEGDVNILVDSGDPECLHLRGTGCCPIGSMCIEFGAADEDEYDEGDAAVLYAEPGEKPVRTTLYDALNRMMNQCDMDTVELLACFDALIAFDSACIKLCEGERYLAAPCIIFMLPDLDVESVTLDDERIIRRILEENTVKLTNGQITVTAYRL